MAITAWSVFVPEIQPKVPGCPVFSIWLEVKRAAQDLFSRSFAWKETLPDQAVSAGATSVVIDTGDTEKDLVKADTVWLDGRKLQRKTVDELNASGTDDWRTHTGVPYAFVQISPESLILYPKPVSAGTLRVFAALQPSETATGIPDDMARQYRDTLIAGARSRLMLDTDKAWSNPGMGAIEQNKYEAGVGSAQHQAATGFGNGRITARKKWC